VVGNAGDLDGDGVETLALPGAEYDGAMFLYDAPLTGARTTADADVHIAGDSFGLGWSGMGHADVDGDGRDDFFVGNANGDDRAGDVYVFFGPPEGDIPIDAADVRLRGEDDTGAGAAIASPGDIDGDGRRELLVGASAANAVYLQYGSTDGFYQLGRDSQASWWDENDDLDAGSVLGILDLTGDGIEELVVGAPGRTGDGAGKVVLLSAFEL
jgi:hypothetical protein